MVTVPANSGIDDTFTHYNSQNDLGGVEVDVSYLTQYSKEALETHRIPEVMLMAREQVTLPVR